MHITAIAARTIRWSIRGDGAARGRGERAAVLLEVRTDRGAIGLGEAAPLPGMSLDTLDQDARAITAFQALAPFEVAPRDAADHRGAAAAGTDPVVRTAEVTALPVERLPFELVDPRVAHALATAPLAARFAIETALCDAIARARRISLAALLAGGDLDGPAAARTVPIAAVVDDPGAARRAIAAGIRCLKVKLDADDPVERVRAIAGAAPEATLRIDANRSWPRAVVPARLAALAGLPVEYVEEPCRDSHLLLQAGPWPCRLALDESLPALSRSDLVSALRSRDLAAVILKPTLLGGLAVATAIAALARRSGVAAIVSHGLEGPIGTAACAELALALAGDRSTAGDGAPSPRVADVTPVGLAAHAALAGWRAPVTQLAADHVHAAVAPGLGFSDLDLTGIVQTCDARVTGEADPA